MKFTLGHANVAQPNTYAEILSTVNRTLRNADIGTFNECGKQSTHRLLENLRDYRCIISGGSNPENAIVWRDNMFSVVAMESRTIMRGGIVNGKRRGPSRNMLLVVLKNNDGERVIVATCHAIAKWETSAPWRRPLALAACRRVGKILRHYRLRYDAPVILTGDTNAVGRLLIRGLTRVPTPPTFGQKHYDRIYVTPHRVTVADIRAFATPSDHRSLYAKVTVR